VQVDVKVTFRQASGIQHTKKADKRPSTVKSAASVPAVEAGTEVVTSTGLPSIMHADSDLITVFLTNLTSSLIVECNASSGECKLVLADDGA
jgi:hypothetical protein